MTNSEYAPKTNRNLIDSAAIRLLICNPLALYPKAISRFALVAKALEMPYKLPFCLQYF